MTEGHKGISGLLEETGEVPGHCEMWRHSEGQRGTLRVTEGTLGAVGLSHPPGLALVLHSLFGVGHGPFHKSDGLVHVVLDAVDHGSLWSTRVAPWGHVQWSPPHPTSLHAWIPLCRSLGHSVVPCRFL